MFIYFELELSGFMMSMGHQGISVKGDITNISVDSFRESGVFPCGKIAYFVMIWHGGWADDKRQSGGLVREISATNKISLGTVTIVIHALVLSILKKLI